MHSLCTEPFVPLGSNENRFSHFWKYQNTSYQQRERDSDGEMEREILKRQRITKRYRKRAIEVAWNEMEKDSYRDKRDKDRERARER